MSSVWANWDISNGSATLRSPMPLCDGRESLTCVLGRLNASADSMSSSLSFCCGMILEIGNIHVNKVFYGPKLIPNALSVPSLSPWLTTASLPPGACLPPSRTHCHSWVRLTATLSCSPRVLPSSLCLLQAGRIRHSVHTHAQTFIAHLPPLVTSASPRLRRMTQ